MICESHLDCDMAFTGVAVCGSGRWAHETWIDEFWDGRSYVGPNVFGSVGKAGQLVMRILV